MRGTEEKFCRLASMPEVQISLQDEKLSRYKPAAHIGSPGPYLGPKTGIPD